MQRFISVYLVTLLSRLYGVDDARMVVGKEGITGEWYCRSMNVAAMAFTEYWNISSTD
jgi:hypothetical protein